MLQELTEIAQERSSEKRIVLLHRLTDIYLDGLACHSEAEELLFDEIMTRILDDIPSDAKAHAAVHLSALPNAPRGTMRKLAGDADINVARPVLRASSVLSDGDLISLARASSQAHLDAIAGRSSLSEPVTDVLVERGDREVALTLSANHAASFSEDGLLGLVDKARTDSDLQERLVERPDLPPNAVTKLLPVISQKLAAKLAERGYDLTEAGSPQLLREVSQRFENALSGRDNETHRVAKWIDGVRAGRIKLEDAILELVRNQNLLGVAALVGAFTALGRNQAFKIIAHGELDPALVLFRSLSLGWPVVDRVLSLRARKRRCAYDRRASERDYRAIEEPLAQRLVRFLKVRQSLRRAEPPIQRRAAS